MKKKRQNKRLRQAFSSTLKRFREEAGLTQETLGFEAGFDRTYISLLERCLASPTLDSLSELCVPLNISLSEIIQAVELSITQLPPDPETADDD